MDELRNMPGWVRVFGIIALVVVVVAVIVLVTDIGGEHGPSRHTSSGDAGGASPPTEVVRLGHTPPIKHEL